MKASTQRKKNALAGRKQKPQGVDRVEVIAQSPTAHYKELLKLKRRCRAMKRVLLNEFDWLTGKDVETLIKDEMRHSKF